MSIYVIAKKKTTIVAMNKEITLTIGMKTERFRFYFDNKLIQEEDRCFSINTPSRSYDFVTKNGKQRDKIVNSFNFLRYIKFLE